MSMSARTVLAIACALPAAARADDAPEQAERAPAQAPAGSIDRAAEAAPGVDMRLTLSSFAFRESGGEAPPLVDMGAPVASASPVRRYFGDLRLELAGSGVALDARVRQTTSERYQSGASSGGEYELRRLAYRLEAGRTQLVLGRQFVDAVGATKVDGAAVVQRLSRAWSGTLFGGAFPQLGSRSLDTDYPELRTADGMAGPRLVPLVGGAGAAYSTGNVHGDLGAAAVYVPEDVPDMTPAEASRVYLTASGYARPARWLDVYHFGLVDVAGGAGARLTNGSVGLDARPTSATQLSASAHHVGADVLQIAARNVLVDPDPTAIGIVQNNIAVVRVSQDLVRGAASLALARARFELSLGGTLQRRPGVTVALADGGAAAFPEARSATVSFGVLDRRSIAGLRVSAASTLVSPLGDTPGSRSRGTVVRLAASRAFAGARGELEVDAMAERFRDLGGGACMTSLDALACFGAARTSAAQLGALASWRVGREWLVLLDAHLGLRSVTSTSIEGTVDYPTATSVTTFARVQWRYR
jgi:hypothetical protein